MRLAAAQLEVDTASRTATLQSALRAIDAAAEQDPAPDLIVLPAFLDTCGDAAAGKFERVPGPGVAACGMRARSWGVFVAFGLAEQNTRLTAVLLDQDGDPRLVRALTKEGGVSAGRFDEGVVPCVTNTMLGRIGLLVGEDVLDERFWAAAVFEGAQCIIAPVCFDKSAAAAAEKAVAELAKRFGTWCAVADVTTGRRKANRVCPGASRIVDSNGKVVGAVGAGETGIVAVDVPVTADAAPDAASQLDA